MTEIEPLQLSYKYLDDNVVFPVPSPQPNVPLSTLIPRKCQCLPSTQLVVVFGPSSRSLQSSLDLYRRAVTRDVPTQPGTPTQELVPFATWARTRIDSSRFSTFGHSP